MTLYGFDQALAHAAQEGCYPEYSARCEDTSTRDSKYFTYETADATTLPWVQGRLHAYDGGGYVSWFAQPAGRGKGFDMNFNNIISAINSSATRVIFTGFSLYSPSNHMLCKVVLTVEFSATGATFASYSVKSAEAPDPTFATSTSKFVIGRIVLFLILLVLLGCYIFKLVADARILLFDIPRLRSNRASTKHFVFLIGWSFDLLNVLTLCAFIVLGFVHVTFVATTPFQIEQFKYFEAGQLVEAALQSRLAMAVAFVLSCLVVSLFIALYVHQMPCSSSAYST